MTVGARPEIRSILVLFALLVALALAGCQAQDADDSDAEADDTGVEETVDDTADDAEVDETPTPEIAEVEADDEATDDAVDEPTPVTDDAAVEGAEYPVTVTRSDGAELTIDEQPQRIVSLSPGATEIFFEIGAGDQLAAVDSFSNYPVETEDVPRIDAYQPDPEVILDMDSDLVFAVYDADGIVEVLDDLDVPVLYLEAPASLDELFDQIRLLGEVTGNAAEAENLASSLEDRVQEIAERAESVDEQPSVYHELDDTYFTVGPDSFVGDLYNILGAENIADGAMGDYPQLSEEIILEESPEVIILPGYGEEGAVDAVRERPGWEVISAVENDRIYEIDGDIVSRPGPRIVDALEQLAEMLYPEEFSSSYGLAIEQIDNEGAIAAL